MAEEENKLPPKDYMQAVLSQEIINKLDLIKTSLLKDYTKYPINELNMYNELLMRVFRITVQKEGKINKSIEK